MSAEAFLEPGIGRRQSRAVIAGVAAFLALSVSIDPRCAAPAPPRRAAVVAVAESAAMAGGRAATVEAIEAAEPAPAGLTVEVTPDGRGAHLVVVRQRGFLVSLRNEDARSAGKDWTSLRVAPRPAPASEKARPEHPAASDVAGRLVWETTPLDGLTTARGVVLLSGDGEALHAELRAGAAPEAVPGWKSEHATCAAQRDGLGGFTALCRFPRTVAVTGAANVTGARSLDDVWVSRTPWPLARLDLPRSPDGAEGRVVGLVHGGKGVALYVEASFPEGEEAVLLFHEAARTQPGF